MARHKQAMGNKNERLETRAETKRDSWEALESMKMGLVCGGGCEPSDQCISAVLKY